MNIILVPRNRKAPRSFDLSRWPVRRRLLGIGALAALVFASFGAAAALWLSSPRDAAVAQISALRIQVHNQRTRLDAVSDDSQRQVNALAQKLGELEAQSMRLNALGERLTEMSDLDDGEFNFGTQPALGGAASDEGDAYLLPPALDASIDALGQRFDSQQAQLQVLQDLLLDHEVASSQRPTGMPVDTGYISSYYGSRIDPFNGHATFHRGIDFAAAANSDVHAVAEGIVSYAGLRSGYGNVIEIDHGNGYVTRYAHNRRLLVDVGQRVHVAQVIAKVGSSGRSTGAHVHFEVWYRGKSLNPLAFVRSHRG